MNSWKKVTHKQLEMHEYIQGTVFSNALVIKHQDISIQSADWILIVLGQVHLDYILKKYLLVWGLINRI